MNRGIFIGRFQPFHNGHMAVVQEMEKAKDLEEIIIGIGTAQIGHTSYNPFTADEREDMIIKSLELEKPYQIIKIPDINDYSKWVSYVESLCPDFNVVYSGNTITKKLFEDKGYNVRGENVFEIISATEVRQLMVNKGNWQDYVPNGTVEVIEMVNGEKRLRELNSKYSNPGVTADVIIDYKSRGIVLIKRKFEPYKGLWAIPGGFLDAGRETIEMTGVREAEEETNLVININDLNLLGVYSEPGRDPRGPTISVAYYTKVNEGTLKAKDDAKEVKVFKNIPSRLAFDHNKILEDYFKIIKEV